MIEDFFTTLVGSHIWRMDTASSDRDMFRVYVASTEGILRGTANTKSEFVQEVEGEDLAVHEVGKVVEQLLKGNVNFLIGVISPMLLSEHESADSFLYELQCIVRRTISKNCYKSIHGLGKHNYIKYLESGKDDSERRCNKICRVLAFGHNLLLTGNFEFTPFTGGTPEAVVEWLGLLDDAYKNSPLPEVPDEGPFRDWLYQVRRYEERFAIKSGGSPHD